MQTKWEDREEEKICGFDIDGVLNYYPDPWVKYVNDRLGECFTDLNDLKLTVAYQTYKDLKYEYRESGIKSTLKVREGAKDVLSVLKNRGYKILIVTSRPFDEHKTLFKQTHNWLTEQGLPYDGVIFGKTKYQDIINGVPNLRFLVDDHRYYANVVAKWGYHTFLIDNKYNKGHLEPKATRINKLEEVLDHEKRLFGDD